MKDSVKKRIEAVHNGKIPNGYEQRPAGLAPATWQQCAIGDVIDFYEEKSKVNNEYPILTSSQAGLVFQSEYFEGQVTREENAGYNIIPYGYLTYRSRSDSGRFTFNINKIIDKGIVSCFYPVFCAKENLCNTDYLLGYLNNCLQPQILKEIVGTSQLVLSEKKLSALQLSLPPLPEQQKIAEILATCDKVIELKKKLLEEKRRQKQWLMQKLLDSDSGVRLKGFEHSVWKKSTIAELFTFGSSMAKSRAELSDEGDMYLHYGDIHARKKSFIDVQNEKNMFPRFDGESAEKTHLKTGDVVFVDASEDYEGISKYVVIENCEDTVFIAGLHTIPCHSKGHELEACFKRYCFQTYAFKKQIAFYANGMKVYGISEKDLGKIEVLYPDTEEQRAIAEVLNTSSHEVFLLEKEVEMLNQKRKAAMQLLLTGLVRVNA